MASLPEAVLQFGAGRFLRAFVDRFVQQANDAGQAVGRVVVVQSTPGARADLLNQQPDGYQVLVRGYEHGELIERVEVVQSVRRALTAHGQWDQILAVARSPELRFVVTNSTEAGYTLEVDDRLESSPPQSMPAKLARVLWERHQAGAPPVDLLPTELIERNATQLLGLVVEQSRRWRLPAAFEEWVGRRCCWRESLVDCIITSPPTDHPLATNDKLLVCAEPYALWAMKGLTAGTSAPFHASAIQVVEDLTPFFLRKVRILNGLHSAMVGKFLPAGYVTVQQVLADREAARWVRGLIYEEIVPTIAYRVDDVADFADQTWDRLRNPFLAHRLSDIALNHADKVRVRLQPTREEYEKLFGKTPRRLAEAMAARPVAV
jgi:tagaturonate reductase